MATMITSECINCGACEPECPNNAIYQGGVEWELEGMKHPPLATDTFYIVPEKCTECVGFYDHEACAAVCPVDCCVPNPEIPEAEEVLIARARQLHPEKVFAEDFPSRFRRAEAAGSLQAQERSEGTTGGAAADRTASKGAAAESPAEPAGPLSGTNASIPVSAEPKAQATESSRSETPASVVRPTRGAPRPERPIAPPKPLEPPAARPSQTGLRPAELGLSFDEAVQRLGEGTAAGGSPLRWLAAIGMPLLGALPWGQKTAVESAVGNPHFFSAAAATGLNILVNMFLYPGVCLLLGAAVAGRDVFSQHLNGLVFLGMAVATLEALWRLREGVFSFRPAGEIRYRASVYGVALGLVVGPLVRRFAPHPAEERGAVGVDGFHTEEFEEKIERERRYGSVYTLREFANGVLVRMELPRRVPPSSHKRALGIPDEMPDYQIGLALQDGYLVIKGKLADPTLRKIASVSPAFPPDFTTRIRLRRPVKGFAHRYLDKTLEVVLLSET